MQTHSLAVSSVKAKTRTYKEFARYTPDEALRRLGVSRDGISEKEYKNRLFEYGYNQTKNRSVSGFTILVKQLRSPFVYLLFGAALIALITNQMIDAAIIGLFIFINAVLGFFQEYHAERASQLLKKYWRNTARVTRNGTTKIINAEHVVPGDVLLLQAGDKIPADVRFLAAHDIRVDESILTGESVAVEKDSEALLKDPGDYYEAKNIGFSGTAIVTGEARAVVYATGAQSSLGRIVSLALETKTETIFEKQISNFSIFTLKLVALTLVLVLSLNIGLKGIGQFEELILFAIALTVGVIPEALPLVMTFALSRGALKMSKRHVIVKRLSAIHDLGSIDVLCTDKTGTITENKMTVAEIRARDATACLRYALLGSSFFGEQKKLSANDFDRALWERAPEDMRQNALHAIKVAELPFDPIRRRNSVLVKIDGATVVIVRGSPEEVFSLCADRKKTEAAATYVSSQGYKGRRLMAVAVKVGVQTKTLEPHDEKNLEFIGCIAFEDALKEGSVAAIKKAAAFGVQVKILTGDAKEVAGAVGQALGLIDNPSAVITGTEFEALPHNKKKEAVALYHVFARVNPSQKYSIISFLQESQFSVGYLGEGFNDVPAIKKANISLAVENASDVAKDFADIILLRQSLAAIIDGIEEGRKTFANTIKYLLVTLAGNFGNFYAIAIASLFVPFLPMLPVQILLVNLLTDTPLIALATDTVATKSLKKPSKYNARDLIIFATALGIISSIFDFVTFALFHKLGQANLQTLWFIESTLTEVVLIYSVRARGYFWQGARVPLGIGVLSLAVIAVAIFLPHTLIGNSFFHFAAPDVVNLIAVFLIVLLYFIVTEIAKFWIRKVSPST